MGDPRRVFITGGASGIGLRLGEIYARRGADIAVFDRADTGEAERRLGLAGSGRVRVLAVDVCDAAAVERAVGEAVESLGPPELAINSAGIQIAKPFEELSAEEFSRVVSVNLIGSRNFAASVLPVMSAPARLVLIASMAGLVPNYAYAAYSASKHGVVGLGGTLRLEYRPRGIGVSVVCPPEVETPMVQEERRTLHPAGAALKDLAGTLDLDSACRGIVAGIDRGDYLIVPGVRARMTVALSRYLPASLLRAMSDRMVASALRRMPAGPGR